MFLGLSGNALFGWWWLDPIAALLIAAAAVREGLETWRGEDCCATASFDSIGAEHDERPCAAAPTSGKAVRLPGPGRLPAVRLIAGGKVERGVRA